MADIHKLYDASAWANSDDIHAVFADLRKNNPVAYHSEDGFPPLWHITKHADIFEVEKNIDIFINEPRTVLTSIEDEEKTRAITGGTLNLVRSLVTMDRPHHTKMRFLTQAWFMPKNLARLQDVIESSAQEGLDVLSSMNGEVDFAKDVALNFPMRVIMAVLGVPREDFPKMLRLTQELFGGSDPEMARDDSGDLIQNLLQSYMEYVQYFNAVTASRRENPTDDVASVIANAKLEGEYISDQDILGYYIIIATAGHDTTSYSLSEAVHHLAKSPELFARLKADPEAMAEKITEEAIRCASPVRHFMRTATKDYELRGQKIKKGDTLIMWYPSGSRDEDLFESPDVFNPDRNTSIRHAAFGHGSHLCLGMHLARQEISSFLVKFAKSVESFELAGDTLYTQASFVSGIKSLPIKAVLSS